MRFLSLLILGYACVGCCSLNMIQTDTHGYADDIVDSDPKSDIKPSPQLEIPLNKI